MRALWLLWGWIEYPFYVALSVGAVRGMAWLVVTLHVAPWVAWTLGMAAIISILLLLPKPGWRDRWRP